METNLAEMFLWSTSLGFMILVWFQTSKWPPEQKCNMICLASVLYFSKVCDLKFNMVNEPGMGFYNIWFLCWPEI